MSVDWEKLAKPFNDKQIKFKVQTKPNQNGLAMVASYVDARDVINRLNEAAPGQWRDEYAITPLAPNGYYALCKLTIGDITRQDVGESDTPKGAVSDALKRAAVKFGIGIHLYEGPKLYAQVDERGRIAVPREKLLEAIKQDAEFVVVRGDGAATGPQPVSSGQGGGSGDFDCAQMSDDQDASDGQWRAIYGILLNSRGLSKDQIGPFTKWVAGQREKLSKRQACELIEAAKDDKAWEALWLAYQEEAKAKAEAPVEDFPPEDDLPF